MPNTIVGLKISSSRAEAVRLRAAFRGRAVSEIVEVPLPSGDPAARSAALSTLGLPSDAVIHVGLGSSEAFHRIVAAPFTDKKRAEKAAPLEAEESLPLPLEQLLLHAHLLERAGRESRMLVAAAPEETVASRVEEIVAAGLHPNSLTTDPLALAALATLSLPAEGQRLIIDLDDDLSQGVGLAGRLPVRFVTLAGVSRPMEPVAEVARFLALWETEEFVPERVYLTGRAARDADLKEMTNLLGRPVELLPFPEKAVSASPELVARWPAWAIPLGLTLREGAAYRAAGANLLVGPFAPAHSRTPWRRSLIAAGVYASILLLLGGATAWLDVVRKSLEIDRLHETTQRSFEALLPDVAKGVDPITVMTSRVQALSERAASLGSLVDPEASPLWALRAISEQIPKDVSVELREFNAEEDRVKIEGVTTSFDAIDRIKARIESLPRFSSVAVSDAKAGVDATKVIFKLTIENGPAVREGSR